MIEIRNAVTELVRAGLRAVADARPERLARKIVDARRNGIPVLAAVGAREAVSESVSLRWRDGRQASMPIGEATAVLQADATR